MNPGPRPLNPGTDLIRGVEGTGVHVSRLQTDDRGAVDSWHLIRPYSSLAVDRHALDTLTAQPEQTERLQKADMNFLAYNDPDRRRPEEPLRFDVPAHRFQQRVARRGQASEVGHGRARDEPNLSLRRQTESLDQPWTTCLFESRSHRGGNFKAGILIPCARQNVGGQRSR